MRTRTAFGLMRSAEEYLRIDYDGAGDTEKTLDESIKELLENLEWIHEHDLGLREEWNRLVSSCEKTVGASLSKETREQFLDILRCNSDEKISYFAFGQNFTLAMDTLAGLKLDWANFMMWLQDYRRYFEPKLPIDILKQNLYNEHIYSFLT